MNIIQHIQSKISEIIPKLYDVEGVNLDVQKNKTEFEGDFTIVIFPLVKLAKKSPDAIGNELGEAITNEIDYIESFNIVKGFLNLKLKDEVFANQLSELQDDFENIAPKNATVMVEYSSPNTNKPLHLGHVRNNLLGFSVAEILKADGYNVIKSQIINDRGIHICKSMLAWEKFGNGETPESTGLKGDKLVGNYYVEFDKLYKSEIKAMVADGIDEETAKKQALSIIQAQEMLLKWENNNPEVRKLWAMMNEWVYAGFNETYSRLGVNFDQVQYESNTYILGKDLIQKGLDSGILYKKEDGSVWCDLTDEGLDQKLLLRSDGTSVYMTQDLGTAVERFKENDIQKLIYTVGNEQDYHFQVLFKILKKLGYEWADQLYHLSYGMVELPEGKMKSREGTVVDADELVEEMISTAKEKSEELGKLESLSDEEKKSSYETVGLGALKYFILKVDPRKKMLFNPAESIDFNGNTGPFIQYTYARIQSLLAKAEYSGKGDFGTYVPNESEKEVIMLLAEFKEVIARSAETLSPALVANYVYELVKSYNSFYQNNPIVKQEDLDAKQFRLQVSDLVAKTIKKALAMLGINVVNRM
ncbi:arginine--tRNA ligase [Epilithonimonas ginsengisoli]|uniref:Arginine--tRNA ligase n=1 Tax=Epilithonimonas ginsengisoli TaxID=1245592 RepID=A0ABU4JLP7_9FLAO|nr:MULTISPECIES: arginine--tRNA ligase [Chryseobacterium group]MBV6881585.1 arginine--tRNA ligase [Epilithonimonas sp. FP105]MDW8550562.1 arginine--tRNA ligase [Epilithonimonas ginsengisoli]OAH69632.1 arginine--tRNA ligase [Chryseobacterium sp. FP211-J200]